MLPSQLSVDHVLSNPSLLVIPASTKQSPCSHPTRAGSGRIPALFSLPDPGCLLLPFRGKRDGPNHAASPTVGIRALPA